MTQKKFSEDKKLFSMKTWLFQINYVLRGPNIYMTRQNERASIFYFHYKSCDRLLTEKAFWHVLSYQKHSTPVALILFTVVLRKKTSAYICIFSRCNCSLVALSTVACQRVPQCCSENLVKIFLLLLGLLPFSMCHDATYF